MIELHKVYQAPKQPFTKTAILKDKRIKTLPTLQTLKTTAFVNKSPRFNYQYIKNPGPGAYQSNYKQKHSGDFHKVNQSKPNIPKHHQWIISKGRQPFQIKQSSLQDCQLADKNLKRKRNQSNWPKDKRFHYDQVDQENIVGPGKYNPELIQIKQRQRSHTLPMRQRATPQIYLQQIMKNRQQRMKIAQFEEQILRQKSQQQMYIKQMHKKSKQTSSPAFKSKSKRLFSQKELITYNIGPGSYNIQPTQENKLQNIKIKSPIKIAQRTKSQFQRQAKNIKVASPSPGPGSYSFSNLALDTHHKKAVLGLILKQQRFNQTNKTNVPGPGQYMRQKFIYLNKDQMPKHHDTFGSTQRFPNIKDSSPFGSYDLSYHDISQKLIKQKEYIQKIQQFKYAIIPPTKNQ